MMRFNDEKTRLYVIGGRDSARKESGIMSNSANPVSARMEYGRKNLLECQNNDTFED
jgi:hypothetical protein